MALHVVLKEPHVLTMMCNSLFLCKHTPLCSASGICLTCNSNARGLYLCNMTPLNRDMHDPLFLNLLQAVMRTFASCNL